MGHVTVEFTVPAPADHTFAVLREFSTYPDLVDTVNSVDWVEHHVAPDGTGTAVSDWEVRFRQGPLRWQEEDVFDPAAGTISFTASDGDFDEFAGGWSLEPADHGCTARFECTFDFGIASLAGMLDPLAARVLTESMTDIITGLVPGTSRNG